MSAESAGGLWTVWIRCAATGYAYPSARRVPDFDEALDLAIANYHRARERSVILIDGRYFHVEPELRVA